MNLGFNNIVFRALVILALMIVGITLWYTNNLANKLKKEEYSKVALWAKATKELSNIDNSNYDISFVFEVVNNNTTVPAIQTNDKGEVIAYRNINQSNTRGNLEKELALMSRRYPPIEIELIDGTKEYIYYKDSRLLQQLKQFPFFMLSIIGAFMLISYFAFSNARIAQQNKVWTGMAKETAHQIGTPLSSLVGWLEYLKQKKVSGAITKEMEKDIDRLTVIASRFSKIGSSVEIIETDLVEFFNNYISYMKKRIPKTVELNMEFINQPLHASINASLFSWVIENIIKNAADAMEGNGKIYLNIEKQQNSIVIKVKDNGKGIPPSIQKTIFHPGYTTKDRGWGLGLSLAKRIVEGHHKGKIYISSSKKGIGTVVEITLPSSK